MASGYNPGAPPSYGTISGPSYPAQGVAAVASAPSDNMAEGADFGDEFQPVNIGVVAGYEFVNPVIIGGAMTEVYSTAQPPLYETIVSEPTTATTTAEYTRPHIDESQARQALLEEVGQHCCYGTGAAKHLIFTDISTSYAFHLTLNTFTEQRETYWKKVPYSPGQPVDGPSNGPAPGPWDLICHPTQMFKDQVTHLEVPHTSNVQACPQCSGNGRIRCKSCRGRGFNQCVFCNGTGFRITHHHHQQQQHHQHHNPHHDHHHHHGHGHHGHHGHQAQHEPLISHPSGPTTEPCTPCGGRGNNNCVKCSSQGFVRCPSCTGFGQVRFYLSLKVTFKDNLKERVIEFGGLPLTHNLSRAQGYEQGRQEGVRVMPIYHHPTPEIVQYSREMIEQALADYQSMRILMQRQVLRSIPVSVCHYMYKKSSGVFWVYGTDHQVAYLDYPQNCCCCCQCNIL